MKPVTIIVPSYCPDETVRSYETRCLVQLAQHTPKELYDLIVMQGGDWSYPQKVNAAVTGVRTKYVAILSNDVFVGPNWLEYMIGDLEHLSKWHCAVLSPQDQNYPAVGGSYGDYHWHEHWWALVLMKTSFYRLMDGLSEELPRTYHDQDFSIRTYKQGYRICRTKNVRVEHVGMATRSRVGGDDSAEKAWMEKRHAGSSELRDWLQLQPSDFDYENLIPQ